MNFKQFVFSRVGNSYLKNFFNMDFLLHKFIYFMNPHISTGVCSFPTKDTMWCHGSELLYICTRMYSNSEPSPSHTVTIKINCRLYDRHHLRATPPIWLIYFSLYSNFQVSVQENLWQFHEESRKFVRGWKGIWWINNYYLYPAREKPRATASLEWKC